MTAPFSDLRLLDLSIGIAGAYCSKLLADAGAQVTIVEGPRGHPLRQWSASGSPIPEDGDGPLFTFLSSSKERVTADPASLDDLLTHADLVVWSPGGELSITPSKIRTMAPHLPVVAITPFGLDGPWSDRAATEFTLQAWSGAVIGLGRGDPDRAPVHVGGQIGEWLAGAYAAAGAMVAWARRASPGGGQTVGELVDVSMLETLAVTLTYFPVTFHDMAHRPFRTGRAVVTPGVETTADGLVGIGVGTGQQWLDFCVMVGHPEWTEDPTLFRGRGQLRAEIAAWMAERSTAEVLDVAGAFRIPHAPIGNGETLATNEHVRARRSIVRNAAGFDEPARPFRFDPDILDSAAVDVPQDGLPADPFSGLRILDLTSFWAGPSCTHALSMLGAEVIHVESTKRPDGTRLLAEIPSTEPNCWEQSGIFSGLNTNKKSVDLDLSTDTGREQLRRLLDTCDVLVENSTPRVLGQVGIDVDEVRAARPDVIIVRMPGFGLDGPWRDDPAFAFVIEDACGLTWMTGHPDQNPLWPYSAGDSTAGVHALCALLIALQHRRRTGEGVVVEAAMLDAALNVAAEQIVEWSANGALLTRDGNRGPVAAPQNLYRTADDVDEPWVAVAVATDEQWAALVAALGRPGWAIDAGLSTAAGRRCRHDELDAYLSEWCATRSADEVVDALWPVGVPVAKVMQPHEQPLLAQLQARAFFEEVEHPVTGVARHSTLPVRWSGGPTRFHRRHAPLLGEHTQELLGDPGSTS